MLQAERVEDPHLASAAHGAKPSGGGRETSQRSSLGRFSRLVTTTTSAVGGRPLRTYGNFKRCHTRWQGPGSDKKRRGTP